MEVVDYSEPLKWREAQSKFELFESKPAAFGKDLRSLINNTKLNDVSQILVPTNTEDKLEYLKEKYWTESKLFYHPVSHIHFLTCCYLGKPLADKFLAIALTKFFETGINDGYFLELGSGHSSYVPITNKLCEKYTPNVIATEYRRVIGRLLITLDMNKQINANLELWKIRNFAI